MSTKGSISEFEQKYNSVMQIKFLLADTTYVIGELGRGSGKSTQIVGSRLIRIANAMPGSKPVIAANSYVALLSNILPAVMKYLNENYIRGIHYEIGKQPPKHFKKPLQQVFEWKHTISTVWGTVFELASIDRIESTLGKNAAHVIIDEALRADEQKTIERIWPILRGDRSLHGHSHYFGGYTIFSSTPNIFSDQDWWQEYREDMNEDLISKIINVAFEINNAQLKLMKTKSAPTKLKLTRFIKKWSKTLNELRKGATFYGHASAFANVKILGLDYIKRQYETTKDFEKFKTSILSIRPSAVENLFFGKFGKHNVFTDSYSYSKTPHGGYLIDTIPIDQFTKKSVDLKHCDHKRALIGGWDPGAFMSLVVAQRKKEVNEFKIIKDFYVFHPRQHKELAEDFANFFSDHTNKLLVLHYDRAGNKVFSARYKKRNHTHVNVNESDVQTFKRELENLGWRVQLKSIAQATIFHWQHYQLCRILFEEADKRQTKIRICENECENLISSIRFTPLRKTESTIEMDKTAEKNLSYEDQILYSPQIATAMMYMLFGEFKHLLPGGTYHSI